MKDRHRHQADGFTLIELVVTIAIAAILLALATPALGAFVKNANMDQAAGQVYFSMNYARNKSIDLREPVGLCPVSPPATPGGAPGTTCLSAFAAGPPAWMVYALPPGHSTPVLLASYVASDNNGLTVSASGFLALTALVFNPLGIPSSGGVINICDDRGNAEGTQVSLSPVGAVTMSPQRGEDAAGQPMSACSQANG